MSGVIQAVIFDMDGVLIDSSDAHYASWRRLAEDLGGDVTLQQFKSTFGRQNRDIIPMLFGENLDADRVAELAETKERYYRELIQDRVPVIQSAPPLVRACAAAGLKCAVGSSGHPQNIAIALSAMGIEGIIEAVVTGHDVTVGKPDPQVFLLAAERLGIAPERCAVIEDAPAGIDAAVAGGMTAIAVTTEHPREALTRAHLIVDDLAELTPETIQSAARAAR